MTDVIERYLKAIAAHDWTTLADTLTPDVVRTGPFFDVFEGSDNYLGFITKLMPTLPNYSMQVERVSYVDGGTRAYAELSETLDVDGKPHTTPEVLTFDIDDDRIARIDIYIKRK
ncbi:MAG: nuclear transport factor 2 family protein [Actinomycetes bacterium]